MDEYIEREAFRKELVDRQITTNFFDNKARHEDGCIIEMLDNFPTADVVPREEAEMMFAEIEEIFIKRIDFYKDLKLHQTFNEKKYAETMITNCKIYLQEIDYLKKKYTEETK